MTDDRKEDLNKFNKFTNIYFWLKLLLHIPNFLKLAYRLVRDKRVPLYLKLICYAALIYVLSPYDLVPMAFIPFLGWIDDVIIFYICLKLLVKYSPSEVVKQHVQKIDQEMKQKIHFRFY